MISDLVSRQMTMDSATIISSWCYPPPYSIYSMDNDGIVDELMNGDYYEVYSGNTLVGYYCTGQSAQVPCYESRNIYSDDKYIDIGLGMQSALTGNGYGKIFFSYIVNTIKSEYKDNGIRLTVATFNKRARHLYTNTGFTEYAHFVRTQVNMEYIVMVYSDDEIDISR